MEISVILATYKRPEILQRTLESFSHLVCGDLKWDLWVVDNAGDADTKKIVDSWDGRLPIHYLVESKAGKNNALNRALSEINGQLVVLTDDDIIATPDWLEKVLQGVQRWPDCVVFGGRVLPHWPSMYIPHDITNPFLIGAYAIANWDLPEGEYDPKWVFGPNMAVRRSIFDEGWRFEGAVGPSQNANYVMGSETEFVLRLEKAGYRPVYLPEALVYHQIRPEQMSFDWLKKRAFRAGKGAANIDELGGSVKTLFGFPRYLVRRAFECFFLYCSHALFSRKKMIESGMRFYYTLGQLSHYSKSYQ